VEAGLWVEAGLVAVAAEVVVWVEAGLVAVAAEAVVWVEAVDDDDHIPIFSFYFCQAIIHKI